MELITAIWAWVEHSLTVIVMIFLIVYFLAVNVQATHTNRPKE